MARQLQLACLCAAWCRLCEAYEPVLAQVGAEFAAEGVDLQLHWIDIEDEAALLGDFDVQTFPTLVLLDEQQVHFAGPLTPQPETLRRLLRALLADLAEHRPAVPIEVEAFAQRLRLRATA